MTNVKSRRQLLVDAAVETSRLGLNHGMSGNLSLREDDGFLITPSACPHERLTAQDIVAVSWDGAWTSAHRPSSEWRFHRDIYRHHSDAGAVIHTHSPWCTTLACLEREIPAFHYMVAMAGGDSIRCADYALFGSEQLAVNILSALRDRKACLIGHHGMVCFERDLRSALALAVEVEHLARLYAQALPIGEPSRLSGQQMTAVLQAFAGYRRQG